MLIKFILGLSTALLLHHIPRFGAVLGGLVLLPYIIPEVVRGLAWRVLLDPLFGALNYIPGQRPRRPDQGLPWLGDPTTALPSVILVNIWSGLPFFIILMVAGLKAIDVEQYEAASIDGASAWRKFLHITLRASYVIIVAVLLNTIFTFNGFTLTYILTGGGPAATRIYTILAYEYAVQGLRYGSGIAVAMTTAGPLPPDPVPRPVHDEPRRRQGARRRLGGLALLDDHPLAVPDGAARRAVPLLGRQQPRRDGARGGDGGGPSAGSTPLLPKKARQNVGYGIMYVLLAAVLLFEMLPFYFIFVTAFKTNYQIQQIEHVLAAPWTLDQFRYLFTQIPFVNWYGNTIMVTAVSVAVSVLASALGAYGLVRLKWRGSSVLSTTVLISYLMPAALMFIPLYVILAQVRLLNTPYALMLTYPTAVLPFATWLMMGYYRSIPEELEDAAMIDGCTRFRAFFRVVLPLVRPACWRSPCSR